MPKTVRCPFCVLGDEFRPMVAHIDGRYICSKCGHTTSPGDIGYECRCPKCMKLILSFRLQAS
jgi:DNA-directed RNA polymerase subunit RPC12/RpoP